MSWVVPQGSSRLEVEKLEGWADDLKVGLEREIKELDRQIKESRRVATTALTLEDKLAGRKQSKAIESLRNQKRRSLFEAQDQVDSVGTFLDACDSRCSASPANCGQRGKK